MKEHLIMTGPRTISFDGPQISPEQWAKVKRCVENIGGVWSSAAQGWEFSFDVERLFMVMKEEKFNLFSHYHFFETPDWLIDSFMSMRYQMAGGLYCNDYKVLEPSAGQGSILSFLKSWGMSPDFCELMPENREILLQKGYGTPICEDFLELDRPDHYDLVFANPPFRDAGQHILKMLEVCKPGGYVCALGPTSMYSTFDRVFEAKCDVWEVYHIAAYDENADYIIGEPIFKRAKSTDCLIFTLKKKINAN